MSINKIYLPNLTTLKEYLNEHGKDAFYFRYVRNKDVFIGGIKSSKFIDEFCKNYFNNETT